MSNARQRPLVDLTVPYEGPSRRPSRRPSPRPRPAAAQRRARWPWLLAAFGFLVVLGGLLLAGISAWWLSGDTIAPGVTVLGLDMGGETATSAAARLEEAWAARTIQLVGVDGVQTVTPGDLGLRLDAASSARRAHRQTRSLDSLTSWLRGGGLVTVGPVWTFDRATAAATLGALSAQVDRAAVDASVRVVDGRPEVTAARPGQRLNLEATLTSLAQDPAVVLADRRLALVVDAVAPAVVDAAPALAAVEALLATHLDVALFDPVSGQTTTRTLDPKLWGQWLTVRAVDPAGGAVDWQLNEAALRTYLSQGAEFLSPGTYVDVPAATTAIHQTLVDGGGTVHLRLFHEERQHVVQSGETLASIGRAYGVPYPWIQQANPQLGQGLLPGQSITIPSPDALLPLPVVADKRVVVSIAEQRVWVYENGAEKWVWPASTGIASSPTAPGIFQIQSHESTAYASNWDLWMPHFLGVYRPVPGSDFMNGFHGFPTRNGSTLLWTGDLGHPVTYGCILLSSDNAATLFNWAEDGVVVEIRP